MRKFALIGFGLVVMVLVALGLFVLSSASEPNAYRLTGDVHFFMKRQFGYLALGVVVAALTAWVDYRKWKTTPALTWFAYGIIFLLLLAVFPPLGKMVKGSYRWIDLGFVKIQPSEFAKLMVVIALSYWLDRLQWRVETMKQGMVFSALIIGVLAFPVMCEPDFGSTIVIGLVSLLIMCIAGIRVMHVLPFALLGGGVLVYRVMTNANRMARIAAFFGVDLNVGADVAKKASENAAYQVHHALVAFSNGGVFGAGMCESMQKHAYLPEAHTDFIFAVGAEEFGLIFSLSVIILFILFYALSLYIARHASDRFGRFLVVGMSFIIFFQAIFNIGVVSGALPTKGIALPFFSYGGTNMISAFFAVGTILSVGIHSYTDRKRKITHG